MPNQMLSGNQKDRLLSSTKPALNDRILSIESDRDFVSSLAEGLLQDVPILANLRNGQWLIPEHIGSGLCYFKSTDGHENNLHFSLVRLNLHVVRLIVSQIKPPTFLDSKQKAVCIVDSTRFGKILPDSIARTIPLWCAVIDKLSLVLKREDIIAKEDFDEDLWELFTTPCFPNNEIRTNQIYATFIDDSVQKLKRHLSLVDLNLIRYLKSPLEPIYLHSETGLNTSEDKITNRQTIIINPPRSDKSYLIICVSASVAFVPPHVCRQYRSWKYTPGASDDEENWSLGLNAIQFSKHFDTIVETCKNRPQELESLFGRLIKCNLDSEDVHFSHDGVCVQFVIHKTDNIFASLEQKKKAIDKKLWGEELLEKALEIVFKKKEKDLIIFTGEDAIKDDEICKNIVTLVFSIISLFKNYEPAEYEEILIKLRKNETKETIRSRLIHISTHFLPEKGYSRWIQQAANIFVLSSPK